MNCSAYQGREAITINASNAQDAGVVTHTAFHTQKLHNETLLLNCITFNPSRVSPTTIRGQVPDAFNCKFREAQNFCLQIMFLFNIDSTHMLDVYVHNKDQLFFPNRNDAFGSSLTTIETFQYMKKGNNKPTVHLYTKLDLDKVEEQSLDKPKERCAQTGKVAECIVRYVEQKANCRFLPVSKTTVYK